MPMNAESISDGDDSLAFGGGAEGADAFLSSLKGEDPRKQPSTQAAGSEASDPAELETTAENAEDTASDSEEESGGNDSESPDDDPEFDIKVGDKVEKAKLSALKRLYGQEAALTQKSQKVAADAKASLDRLTLVNTALNKLLERAQERYKPYADLDFLVLSQSMANDPETFAQLRQDAKAAGDEVRFLQQELQSVVTEQQNVAQKAYQEAATACVKALENPTTGIKGFGKELYSEMLEFCEAQGFKNARAIVDPTAIKLIHMAMLYGKQQTAATSAAQKIAKAPAKPSKMLTPGTGSGNGAATKGTPKAAMDQLRRSGSVDDAADAFLASMRG